MMPEVTPDFESIIQDGIVSLRWVEDILLRRLERQNLSEEAIRDLRDVRSLIGRLSDTEVEEWQKGWMDLLSPADLDLLERWDLEVQRTAHTSEDRAPSASWHRALELRRLREFLARYMETRSIG